MAVIEEVEEGDPPVGYDPDKVDPVAERARREVLAALRGQPEAAGHEEKMKEAEKMVSNLTMLSSKSDAEKCTWRLEKANKFREEANGLFREKRYDECAVKYKSALDLVDGDEFEGAELAQSRDDLLVLLHSNMAQLALCQQRWAKAVGHADEVLSRDPNHSKAHFRKAKALLSLGAESDIRLAASHVSFCMNRAPLDTAVLQLADHLYACARGYRTGRLKLPPPRWKLAKVFRDLKYIPAAEGYEDCNLVIFFHGFGDRNHRFEVLAKQMKLPNTATICLNAPLEIPEEWLPDGKGFSWFDVVDEEANPIEARPGEMRRVDSLEETHKELSHLFRLLTEVVGWKFNEIFLFGFQQGGEVVLDLLHSGIYTGDHQFGGVVVKNASVIAERGPPNVTGRKKSGMCPLLLLGKCGDSARRFEHCCDITVAEADQGVALTEKEMEPLMSFFAKSLRHPPPGDCLEVGKDDFTGISLETMD